MPDAAYFHAKADQCRGLLQLAADREIVDQLRLWIADFETDAATEVRRAASANGSGADRMARLSWGAADAAGRHTLVAANPVADRGNGAEASASGRPTKVSESYRALAAQCREMAKLAAKPGALLTRAHAFEASAAAIERAAPADC